MLSKRSVAQLIVGAFLVVNAFGFADQQPVEPRQFEGTEKTGIMHYEGDLEDNLANPLDSTNDELDQEAEDLEQTQKNVEKR